MSSTKLHIDGRYEAGAEALGGVLASAAAGLLFDEYRSYLHPYASTVLHHLKHQLGGPA